MFRNLWFWFCIAWGALLLAGMFGGLLYLYGMLGPETAGGRDRGVSLTGVRRGSAGD